MNNADEIVRALRRSANSKKTASLTATIQNYAADLIESLQADLARVTAERDAAVRDVEQPIFGNCHVCGCVVSNLIKTCPRCGKPIQIGHQPAVEDCR